MNNWIGIALQAAGRTEKRKCGRPVRLTLEITSRLTLEITIRLFARNHCYKTRVRFEVTSLLRTSLCSIPQAPKAPYAYCTWVADRVGLRLGPFANLCCACSYMPFSFIMLASICCVQCVRIYLGCAYWFSADAWETKCCPVRQKRHPTTHTIQKRGRSLLFSRSRIIKTD